MSGRRSRRTRGEKPELVPPKSDEEDNDTDDKEATVSTTRGRGRRGKRVGSSSSLSQLATASKKPASRKKAAAKETATKKKRGRPRGRPRAKSPSPSESSISASEEEQEDDEDNASENEASDSNEASDAEDSNNEGSEEEEDEDEDNDDAERDTEDDAPKEALTGKKKSARKPRKKKGPDDVAAHPRYKNPIKIECRNCGKLCFSQGIKIHEKSCMPVYTPRDEEAKPKKQQQRRKKDEESENSSNESQQSSTGNDGNNSDSSDDSSSPPSPVVIARKNTRFCKHCGNMVSSRGFMQHQRSCMKKAMEREDDDDDDDDSSNDEEMDANSVESSPSSSVAEESPPKKKRGRKPKAKAAVDASSSGDEEDPPKKKRGRKATSKTSGSGDDDDDDDESSSQSEKPPKKRGRPLKAKPASDSENEDESSSASEDPPKKRGRTRRSKQGDDSLASVGENPQTKRGRKAKDKSSDKPAQASDEEGSDGFSQEDLLPISALAAKKAEPTATKGQQKKTPRNSKLSKAAAETAPITNFFSPKASGSAKDPAKTTDKSDEDDENKVDDESVVAKEGATSADENSDTEKTGETTGDTKDSGENVGEETGQENADRDEAKSNATTETPKASTENATEETTETAMDLEKDPTENNASTSTRPTRKRKLTMKAAEAAATESSKTEEKSETEVVEDNPSVDEKESESEVAEESKHENSSEASAEDDQQDAADLPKDPKNSASIVEAAKNAAAATLAMFPLFSAKPKSTEEENMELDSEDNGPDDSKTEQSALKQDGDTDANKTTEASANVTDDASLDKDKGIAAPSTETQSNEQAAGKESEQAPPNSTTDTSSKEEGDETKPTNEPMEIDSTGEENGDMMDVEPESTEASSSDKANGDSGKETESPAIGLDSDVVPGASNEKTIESASITINGDSAANDKSHAEQEKTIDGNELQKETAQSSPNTETKDALTTDEAPESSSVTVEEKAVIPQDGVKSVDERQVATEGDIIGATNSEDPKQSETGEKEEVDTSVEEKPTATDQKVSAQTELETSPTSAIATSHDTVEKATDSQSIEQPNSGKLNEGVAENSGNGDSSDSMDKTKAENGNAEHSEPIKPELVVTNKTIDSEGSINENEGTSESPIATTSSDSANLDNDLNGGGKKETKTMSDEKANSSAPLEADDTPEAEQTDACKDSSSMTESGEKKITTESVEMAIDAPPSSSIATAAAETTQMEVDQADNIDEPKECSLDLANEENKSKETEEIDAEIEETSVGADPSPEEHDSTMQIEIPNEALSEPEEDMPSPKVEMKVSWVPLSKAPRQAKSSKENHQFAGFDESKANRVKMLLYTTGSKVHRGRGFERIFGMYWDAVCLRLSRPLNGNASKLCDQAISAFLKSKQLRKIHNKFVMSIMRRALKDRIRYSEVSENIPSKWQDRVKVPHVTASRKLQKKKPRTFYDGLEKDLLQLSSVPHIDGTAPYKELWECPTDAIDEIYKNPQEGPSVPIASSCIPGALVVDPMLRETVEAGGMKVTDNAMWYLTVALKEHIKNILNDSIEYKKGLKKGEIFSQAIRYPNVLASTSTKRKLSRGRTAPDSPEKGHKKQINSIDLFAALNMMPSGQPSSIGGSVSRMSLEQTFLSGFNSIPSFDTGKGFNDVQGFITNTITAMAKTRKPEEKRAKATSNTESTDNSATKVRKTQQEIHTPDSTPMANLESPPLASDKSPADANTSSVGSSLPKATDVGKTEQASSGVNNNSQGDESRTSGASDVQVVKVDKPVQQLATGDNAAGPLKSGAGRGAKNLAALIARTTESTTGDSNDSSQGEEKPNNASTDAAANSEPPKPSADTPTNELPKGPVESKPADGTNPQSSGGAGGDNEPQPTPSVQTAAPVRRGQGKGFGSKDLAAMRARSMTSTQSTEEETASKPPEN